ncbi:N-acetylmuramic acid 6-phosphate etherase [Terrarubrum flagellatum]|uniref:N-acetylmuramic acid 6-phosphate etherase n=1 Tax=Terrirubrum flagellatum TaxID=2895980 RepID=UPI003144DE3C
MSTESVSERFTELDAWSVGDALEAMLEGQMRAAAACVAALPAMTAAVEGAAAALGASGRLVYLGAGTSGRVAVQDGAELPPTFNWPRKRLLFLMAGGPDALLNSVEGAEDDGADAARQIDLAEIGSNDVVIGVAASGRTPFTVSGVRRAAERGALTIGVANNPGTPLLDASRHPVLVDTGAEVIAGSTRMKAGTAQKIVLNLLSTGIMIRLGRIYRGMMVNMLASNAKLRKRSEDIVVAITGCDEKAAREALDDANGDMKLASLIALGIAREEALVKLAQHSGNLRRAISAAG